MKNVLLLLTLMLSISFLGTSQTVPEKATTIILTQKDSIGLREIAIKGLNERGHTVNSAKTAKNIATAANTLKNGTRVSYTIQFEGQNIILTGKLPIAGQASQNIIFQGKKGTPTMNGWEEMEKVAKAIGGTISYK